MGLDNMEARGTPLQPIVDPVTQASAASLANVINYFITKYSGTNAITGFRLPRGFRGLFCLIPTGAFTMSTGGALAYSTDGTTEDIPIAHSITAVATVPILMISDGNLCYQVAGLTGS